MISDHDIYYEVCYAGSRLEGQTRSLYAVLGDADDMYHRTPGRRDGNTAVLYLDNEVYAVRAGPGWDAEERRTRLNSHGCVVAWIDSNRSARVRLAGAHYDTTTIISIPHSLLEDSHEANMQKLRDLVDEFLAAFDRVYST